MDDAAKENVEQAEVDGELESDEVGEAFMNESTGAEAGDVYLPMDTVNKSTVPEADPDFQNLGDSNMEFELADKEDFAARWRI